MGWCGRENEKEAGIVEEKIYLQGGRLILISSLYNVPICVMSMFKISVGEEV